jgi:paraquat-inducible protein A
MQIHFGLSFWALALFVLLDIYLTKSVHIGELWELRYRIFEMDTCQIGSLGDPLHQEIESADIVRCPVCEAVNLNSESQIECHRCASTIYQNPMLSTSKAWAFLVTALILYVPANLYPILISEQFHTQEGNTIIGGIIVLWEEGSYPIALIILIASVLVPILKFIVLLYLLISNRRMKRYKQSKVNQHKLHYLTEVIGPWSMVDVFVVAVLTGLVQLTTVKVLAGPGATAFVLMVLFTMFAALSVDTRLFEERRENGPS